MYRGAGWAHRKEFFTEIEARNYFAALHSKMKSSPAIFKNGLTILLTNIALFPFQFLKRILRDHSPKPRSKKQILFVGIPMKESSLR